MEYAAVIVLVAAVAAALFMVGLPRIISDGLGDAVGVALGAGESTTGDTPGTEPGGGDPGDTDPAPPENGIPGGTDLEFPGGTDLEGGPEAPAPWDGSEGFAGVPLLYQPESGNGVTPTHGSYNAEVAAGGSDGGNLRDDDGYETEFNEDGTAGSDPDDDDIGETGLGPITEGSSIDGEMHPPEWEAPPEHNEHGSVEVTEEHESTHRTWMRRARVAGWVGLGNASRNMRHYLENSGEPLEQDVDSMLNSVDRFSSATRTQQQNLIQAAILEAQEEGGSGPYTFPIRTDWDLHAGDSDEDPRDWYFASGSWTYSQTGQITVNREVDGSWSYDLETQVHMRDQYDWHGADDQNLAVTIPFIGQVDDEELAELARAGLAQEYTMYGTSDPIARSGTYTENDGLHEEFSSGPGTR